MSILASFLKDQNIIALLKNSSRAQQGSIARSITILSLALALGSYAVHRVCVVVVIITHHVYVLVLIQLLHYPLGFLIAAIALEGARYTFGALLAPFCWFIEGVSKRSKGIP